MDYQPGLAAVTYAADVYRGFLIVYVVCISLDGACYTPIVII